MDRRVDIRKRLRIITNAQMHLGTHTLFLAERDLDLDVIIERFSTPLLMHRDTWIAGRSIEDGSCLYINEGIKMHS